MHGEPTKCTKDICTDRTWSSRCAGLNTECIVRTDFATQRMVQSPVRACMLVLDDLDVETR